VTEPADVGSLAGRRRKAVLAGHTGDEATARGLLADPDPTVRAAALGALARLARLGAADIEAGVADGDARVRRRACEVAVAVEAVDLRPVLADPDPAVVEAAAWALGESGAPAAVDDLARVAVEHPDPLCREAAVAALGAIGSSAGLAAILAATTDKPAVRRRAVIALAPFEGPEVDAALQRALGDRDWQVRQAAEDLRAAAEE
jgi:HEAT repeat protein